MDSITMRAIAHIQTDFQSKFGVPRQSGLVDALEARIVFEPEFRNKDAVRGLEGFSHIWLIWQFSEAVRDKWSPTVRPPRLGGNTRVGVFATRSPFRPNNIGLSSVRLIGIDMDCPEAPVLRIAGADLMNGTPIFDVKPYLPYTDSHPNALGGFAEEHVFEALEVNFPNELLEKVPADKRRALIGVLEGDPRPSYQSDPERVYGFVFAGLEVRFTVDGDELTVCEVM